jgi:NitT/TauT family transport system permease protein
MKKRYYLIFTIIILLSLYLFLDVKTTFDLIYGTIRSIIRMIAAYILSILFSLLVGLLIIHNEKAYDIIFPICDVLQGVPVLGFFPFAIYFFIHTFPAGWLGQECAAVFLIFTGMTWSILFSIIEAGTALSRELKDLSLLLKLDPTRYLIEIFLPLAFPSFVSASITGWGGGWYFLFASEFLTMGRERIALPGLGTFIAKSAFKYSLLNSLVGLGILAWIVLGTDIYLWQPMLKKVRKRWEHVEMSSEDAIVNLLDCFYNFIKFMLHKISRLLNIILNTLGITPKKLSLKEKEAENPLVPVVAIVFLGILSFKCPSYFPKIFFFAFCTIIRILIGLVLSIIISLTIALLIAKNKKALQIIHPILDIGQSLPAVSLFPIIIVTLIHMIGGRLGVEIGTILLIITGMVWYLIFRLIREMQNYPLNLDEFAKLIKLPMHLKLIHIILPFLFPSIVVGTIQAVGGGWNATIIGEYIVDEHGNLLTSAGLGYLLSYATYKGDLWLSMLAVSGMTLAILLINNHMWKPLLKRAAKIRW